MNRIALLIPTLDRSGAEKQFALLATRLPRAEFDVRAIALTRGGPYEALLRQHDVPLQVLGKRTRFDPLALWRLKRLLRELNPDILHTWLFAANAYGRLAVGWRPHPKVIVSERCVDTWKSGWQLALDRALIPRTTRLVGNSRSVAEFYRGLGVPEDRLAVIPNGIELPSEEPADRAAVLEELNIPPNAKVVGYVGRLAAQKRVRDLVWAAELLRQLVDPVYFLFVGDGPDRDWLMRFAQDVNCFPQTRFLGHRADVPRLLRAMDVFWLASDFEGMSNSIMEAMAAGVPIVASDIPPNRELVVPGETGYLVKVGDSVGFNQFTLRLLRDPELARSFGKAGRERIGEEFSISRMVNAYAALYREVLTE